MLLSISATTALISFSSCCSVCCCFLSSFTTIMLLRPTCPSHLLLGDLLGMSRRQSSWNLIRRVLLLFIKDLVDTALAL
ncbi:hypothetical protein V8F33_012977 [Rhypophila sp. PSN 637]